MIDSVRELDRIPRRVRRRYATPPIHYSWEELRVDIPSQRRPRMTPEDVDTRDELEYWFRHLKPDWKLILWLETYFGMNSCEVARAYGVSKGAIYKKEKKAMKELTWTIPREKRCP